MELQLRERVEGADGPGERHDSVSLQVELLVPGEAFRVGVLGLGVRVQGLGFRA